jgi:hypothetical protein
MLNRNIPPIYFYYPQSLSFTNELPQNFASYWQWHCSEKIPSMNGAGCVWILQTYLHLHDRNFLCQLVTTMPKEGIVVTFRDFLEDSFQPSSKLLLVCVRADVDRHPYSQLHIVQNPYQSIPKRLTELWESHYIPHWPQPALISRNPQRGDTFENVTFLGNEVNFAPEFQNPQWYEGLDRLGLQLQKKLNRCEWNDFSSTDVFLSVRYMGTKTSCGGKPASKLYNAWHAGVPAIFGYESAYRFERKNELDYIEATSLDEVIIALSRLKEDKQLRHKIVKNGLIRAEETQSEIIARKWENFLLNIAIPAYQDWCSMTPLQQQLFLKVRQSFIALRPTVYLLMNQTVNLVKKKFRKVSK